jgi:hypothetical protein
VRKGSRDLVSLDLRFWKGMVGGKTRERECDVACQYIPWRARVGSWESHFRSINSIW